MWKRLNEPLTLLDVIVIGIGYAIAEFIREVL